jgi:hypothetical protein
VPLPLLLHKLRLRLPALLNLLMMLALRGSKGCRLEEKSSLERDPEGPSQRERSLTGVVADSP